MNSDEMTLIKRYVALWVIPLAILAGPEQSGEVVSVNKFAEYLLVRDKSQLQILTSHSWWQAALILWAHRNLNVIHI
jgi:hypothetical protein